jgi:hypothetical protein
MTAKKAKSREFNVDLNITVRISPSVYNELVEEAYEDVGGPPYNRDTGVPLAVTSAAHKAWLKQRADEVQYVVEHHLEEWLTLEYSQGEAWVTSVDKVSELN